MARMDPREPTHWPQDPQACQTATTQPNECEMAHVDARTLTHCPYGPRAHQV
ncbi:hypothetical protein BDN67DRAFT_975520, partial [Paxillus ammoniavirescens]